MATLCCDYKTARRGMLVTNMLILLFAIIFIGVGATTLSYAQSFASELGDYCISKCALTTQPGNEAQDPIGCQCKPGPGSTTLPTVVFMTPSVGLIVIGVFTTLGTLVGCVGAIRQRRKYLYAFSCGMIIIMILQLGFGAAAGAVASGNAPDITGPAFGKIRSDYKNFDWKMLSIFFPEACYAGSATGNVSFPVSFPLCAEDLCVSGSDATSEEQKCCGPRSECRTDMESCITVNTCLDTFFRRAGAPVATMCFLPIVLEVASVVFACVNVFKKPPAAERDFA